MSLNKELFVAIKDRNLEEVECLLLSGADVNARMDDNESGDESVTPLMMACEEGCIPVVEALIKAKADINAQSDSGETALMKACNFSHTEVIKLLIESKANIQIKDINEEAALFWSVIVDDVESVKVLLAAGAKLDDKNDNGMTVFDVIQDYQCPDVESFFEQKELNEIAKSNHECDVTTI